MRALFAVAFLAAVVAASITPKKSITEPMAGNLSVGKPTEKWHYNYFGGDFEPLVLGNLNLLFIPVNFEADGSAVFAIDLDSGLTKYTMRLNYETTNKMWGPGQHSFDPKTNYLYLTNSTDFICINALNGSKVWVTPAPAGVTTLGLGEVAVAGNGFVYYSGQGYVKNGTSQFTILDAKTGAIVLTNTLWSGSVAAMCMNDPANAMGPRPLYENTNSTVANKLLFACGGCVLATLDITGPNMVNPVEAWVSPLDNCDVTQVPRGGYTVNNQFDELVYQWNGNNLTALNAKHGNVQWNYQLPVGTIINAPAVDVTGNIFLAHIAEGQLNLQKLGGIRRSVDWTWKYTSSNSSVVDYHVVYDDDNEVFVSFTTSTPGSASKGTSYLCGIDARSGKQGWCTTVVDPAQGTPKSSRVALTGPYILVASDVNQAGTPFSSGTITNFVRASKGPTPAPDSGIILMNCTGADCGTANCKTEYPASGCNAGVVPGSSVLYFCEGGNTLLYAQYFSNSSTCTGLPSSAQEYGVGVCHAVDKGMDSILVSQC